MTLPKDHYLVRPIHSPTSKVSLSVHVTQPGIRIHSPLKTHTQSIYDTAIQG